MAELRAENRTSSSLYAASHIIDKYCEAANANWFKCKAETEDPLHCVEQSKAVVKCSNELFKKIDANCPKEFSKYADCIFRLNNDFRWCPKEQAQFDACWSKVV
eukprot:TRINITY_DN18485_c0_g1_i1.p2 TRINITY_DN18485_c0_g1~~TRINITY_DN18485_c0_g1_i1.p2  ORF type:complete len:104 (-),score=21.39 TRINITY_DN18485_c0_g1_i1:392-703(-)